MPSRRFLELQASFHHKQDELAHLLSQTRDDGSYTISPDEAQRRDAELNTLYDELKSLEALESMAERHSKASEERRQLVGTHHHGGGGVSGGSGAPTGVSHASLGQLVKDALVKSPRTKDFDREFDCDVKSWLEPIEYKATMLTSSGYLPEPRRIARIADLIAPQITVLDLFSVRAVETNPITYMEEVTSTGNITAEIAEGGPYPESAIAFVERSVPIRKTGCHLPISDEQIADVPGLTALIDGRLRYYARRRLETQLILGDGLSVNILGLLNHASVPSQAKGTDDAADAIYKAMVLVRVDGEASPSAVLINPLDFQPIRLMKTALGYVWGSPSEAGPVRIWGVPIVETSILPQGTAMIGDFSHAEVMLRSQAQVEIGTVGTQFTSGLQTLRVTLRAGLAIYRGEAFALITGL
jgi:HK97 family phage major capsid protein